MGQLTEVDIYRDVNLGDDISKNLPASPFSRQLYFYWLDSKKSPGTNPGLYRVHKH
jgi:hypothetical protein